MISGHNRQWRKFLFMFLVLVVGVGSFSGCTTLRKKFTRKKSAESTKEDFIPVLQPVEYKVAVVTSGDTYQKHYTLTQAFFNDLWESLGNSNSTDKQQLYAFTQLTVHLQGMSDVLLGEKRLELELIISQVKSVMKEYDKASAMRRYDIIKSNMKRIEKSIRKDYKPSVAGNSLKTGA